MEKTDKLLNQDTTMIDLPARCVGQNVNLVGTYIIDLGKFQPSYLPEIQIWLVTGYFRQHVWKESLQHKPMRRCCKILWNWTKTWAGSATYMWTRSPRQAWPCRSLTTKHYGVQVGNHHWWYQSPCAWTSIRTATPFPRTNQSVAWCAREYIWSGGN